MTRSWSAWIPSKKLLIIPPVAIGIAVFAYSVSSKKELPRTEQSESAVPLQVIVAQRSQVSPQITGFGTASPLRRWNAVAEVGGRITATHPSLRSGTPIAEGELLVQIDRTDYELQLSQQQADLKQTESQLQELKLNQTADNESLKIQRRLLDVRKDDLKRMQTLSTTSAASQSELDQARATLLQQEQTVQNLINGLSTYPAKIASAEAAMAVSQSRIEQAQRDLERTRITAPFNGLLASVSLEPGQYVAPGQSLFELTDTSIMEVETQVSLQQWSKIQGRLQRSAEITEPTIEMPRQTAEVLANAPSGQKENLLLLSSDHEYAPVSAKHSETLDALIITRSGETKNSFVGIPSRLSSSLDERTRTLGVIVRVKNPAEGLGSFSSHDPRLRSGAYCEVTLRSTRQISAFRLPRSALDGSTVLCVDSENRIQRRTVEILFTVEETAIIGSGIQEGDLIVKDPPASSMEGQLVQPKTIAMRDEQFR